uniref:Putative holin n=1 Tax=viral metagenome TaxID=1070528 RepID=A0A6M3LHI0_9ZZZZ
MDLLGIGKAVLGAVDTVADKFFVDAADKEKFKLEALKMAQEGKFKEQEIQLSAILAEAQSSDPWTSRARPSFMYVMYLLILFAIPMGVLTVFNPGAAKELTVGVSAWLTALPDELYYLFGVGYLGYTGARSIDKRNKK